MSEQQEQSPLFKAWFGGSAVVDEQGQPRVVFHGTSRAFEAFKPGSWFAEDVRGAAVFINGGRRSNARIREGSALVPVYLAINKPLDLSMHSVHDSMTVRQLFEKAGATDADMQRCLDIMEASALEWWNQVQADPQQAANWTFGHRMPGARGASSEPRTLQDRLKDSSRLWSHLDSHEVMAVLKSMGYDGVKTRESVRYNPNLAEGKRLNRKLDVEVTNTTWLAFAPEQVKSATGNGGQFDPEDPRICFKRASEPEGKEDAPADELEEDVPAAPRF
ncbi:hypothetical protein LJR168_003765 [Pseudoxanthomonas sp. LjRoot168]|uniref:ADP-ribosyltransferase-containing protein n=1 Tax=unclassified Pseudoxanthomonas TaxID=2645906 RepID=UPI003ECFB1DB